MPAAPVPMYKCYCLQNIIVILSDAKVCMHCMTESSTCDHAAFTLLLLQLAKSFVCYSLNISIRIVQTNKLINM